MTARVSAAAPEAQAWTVESVLRWATEDFRARGIERPRLDAELLLAHALGCPRIRLVVDSKKPLEPAELARFRELIVRRRAREPIAYIVGQREFYGRLFRVDRRVLVPRPDSETLVDVALGRTRVVALSMRALDLCTGSGCIAITLARERPTAKVLGTDVSPDALTVARENALRLGAYGAAFACGDLYGAVGGGVRPFDLVVANPPYIATSEIGGLAPEITAHEPRLALDGGDDGLALLRPIVEGARAHLRAGGVLAVEVGAGAAGAVVGLFEHAGYAHVRADRDGARIERVVSGVL
jgi:release factor glutamine methyltransferase